VPSAEQTHREAFSSTAGGDGPTRAIPEMPLDAFLDPFIEVDGAGMITGWNSPAETAFGWTYAEAIGHRLSEFLAPSSWDASGQAFRDLFGSAARSTQNQRMKATALHRDGHEFPIEVSLFPTRCGEACRIGALARDLSRPHDIAAEGDQGYHAIVDQLSVPFIEVDLRGNYVYANKAYFDTFQVSSQRVGLNYKAVLDPEVLALVREIYRTVYKTGKPARLEHPYTFPDGRRIFVEHFISLRRNAAGEPVGFIGISLDCTERKQYEMEAAQTRAAAEAASRSKSEFLANMSHEIRTPLNGVLGMLELARCTDLNPEQKELLGMAQDSANSLLVVLNDILDFSKIEAGKLDLEHAEFDLPETIGEAMRTMAIRAHQKRLELAYELAPGVPQFILGDPSRLKQVLINLTGNAIKFTERGEVVLRVERACQGTGREEVKLTFSVSDTGIGIPEAKQKLIFGAFSQADASTTRKYGGTGLGLAISSRIVKLMGGEIEVESQVGAGSTFRFTAGFGLGRESGTAATTNTADLRGLAVLIVDDNATNRRILETTLASWGMLPVTAESGPVALDIMKRKAAGGERFPLALLDFQMPEMNGFELIQQIRNTPSIAPSSIMTLTSDDYHGSAQRCRQAGISYLIKPFKHSELLASLRALLRPDASRKPILAKAQDEEEKMPPLNILLAEDNLVNQRLAVRLLQRLGHGVVVAATGREVLARLEEQSFDLVLMDVQMPEMDGFRATAAIREKERPSQLHLPIIAMTAHAMSGDRQLCMEAGMDDYIAKPIDVKQLKRTMRQVMQARTRPDRQSHEFLSLNDSSLSSREASSTRESH
jgi:two-component system, sensor histidine kinase and response regulator